MRAEIHTDTAVFTKESAVGEEETGVFCCLDRVLDLEGLTVNPSQIGGFNIGDFSIGDFLADGRGEKISIFTKVSEKVLSPGFAVSVGCFSRIVSDAVDLRKSVAANRGEATSDGVIWNDRKGVAEAGNIVGFARSQKGNGSIAQGSW